VLFQSIITHHLEELRPFERRAHKMGTMFSLN
jgi:hypothetical protein